MRIRRVSTRRRRLRKNSLLLAAAVHELNTFIGDERCDHPVGICYCDAFRLISEIEEKLRLLEAERSLRRRINAL